MDAELSRSRMQEGPALQGTRDSTAGGGFEVRCACLVNVTLRPCYLSTLLQHHADQEASPHGRRNTTHICAPLGQLLQCAALGCCQPMTGCSDNTGLAVAHQHSTHGQACGAHHSATLYILTCVVRRTPRWGSAQASNNSQLQPTRQHNCKSALENRVLLTIASRDDGHMGGS